MRTKTQLIEELEYGWKIYNGIPEGEVDKRERVYKTIEAIRQELYEVTANEKKQDTAAEPKQIQTAQTIINQLGGNRFRVMTGVHNIVALERGVQFSFKGSQRANKCRIVLTGLDLYEVEFYKYSPKSGTCKLIEYDSFIYADMLQDIFTQETGLDCTL